MTETYRLVPGGSDAEDGAEAAAPAENAPNKRRTRRQQVLKRGQIIFGFLGSTIDCLVIDHSPFGARLETPVMTEVPEQLRIRFAGETHDAICRWSAGNRLGLEFVGPKVLDEETLRRRRAIRQALRSQGVPAAARMLRDAAFFNNPELQQAAEAAEAAFTRLSDLLD